MLGVDCVRYMVSYLEVYQALVRTNTMRTIGARAEGRAQVCFGSRLGQYHAKDQASAGGFGIASHKIAVQGPKLTGKREKQRPASFVPYQALKPGVCILRHKLACACGETMIENPLDNLGKCKVQSFQRGLRI